MGKNLGFTRFEFYFVISVIGVIVLVAIQRYSILAEETKRLTFEAIAKNFNAAVYNHHARWIMAQQQPTKVSQINIDGVELHFSLQGWPLAVISQNVAFSSVSSSSTSPSSVSASQVLPSSISSAAKNCLSLWKNLLVNSPSISYNGYGVYGSSTYHLSLISKDVCRFELVTAHAGEYYFDYAPVDGKVTIHSPSITKNP